MSIKTIASLPLCQTEDYNIFETIIGNREQNTLQTNKLVRVIKEYGNITEVSPLLVNEKHQIIDGQHRWWAFKKLAEESKIVFPLFFIVRKGLTEEEAKLMNAGSKPWSLDDFAKSYSHDGNENYSIFLSFRKRYELNGDVLMKYLSPAGGDRNTFKNGEFKVERESASRSWCNRLQDMESYYRDYKHRSFALAFLQIVSHPNYDHARMVEQLERYAQELIKVPLKNVPMKEALQNIYNKGRGNDKVIFE